MLVKVAAAETKQSARKVATALPAWPYSQRVRTTSQLAGAMVQFLVALLPGMTQMKKITSASATSANATALNQNAAPSPRRAIASHR